MAGRRGAAVNAAVLCVTALVLNGSFTPGVAQFIVHSTNSTCPTNRYFLSSLDDVWPAYASLSGVYISTEDSNDKSVYQHELGHASLHRYIAENYGDAKQMWYIEGSDLPASGGPALPAPGPVMRGDPASPRAHLRSTSGVDDWQVWSEGDWVRVDSQMASAYPTCGGRVRLRCVSAGWRCPAGRLFVSGLSFEDLFLETEEMTLKGRLLGADQPVFDKDLVADDDFAITVDASLPAYWMADRTNGRLSLGTFLMTGAVHMNRPVYSHAGGAGDATFLYFDRLETADGESLPLWIIGPQPSRVSLTETQLFFSVDSAARPEEITKCWQQYAGGMRSRADLNISCEHGRTPSGPLNGADCDFELPGACGYWAKKGQLRQLRYSDDQPGKVWAAGDEDPGRFYAQITYPDRDGVELVSQPFVVDVNGCISLQYRMRTAAFFRCQFSLVSEADGSKYILFTMSSAARDWMHIRRNVTAGHYRLHVSAGELDINDELHIDNVRVSPGTCGQYTSFSPCSRQPCANGGTCVPTGATTYTCLCQGQFQGRNCRPSPPCPPPPKVPHGTSRLVPAPSDALPTTSFSCKPEFELADPRGRSVATCLNGEWRGVPECRRSGGETAKLGTGRGAAGRASSAGVTVVAALVVLTALRRGQWQG